MACYLEWASVEAGTSMPGWCELSVVRVQEKAQQKHPAKTDSTRMLQKPTHMHKNGLRFFFFLNSILDYRQNINPQWA